jgi:hypothetical protein
MDRTCLCGCGEKVKYNRRFFSYEHFLEYTRKNLEWRKRPRICECGCGTVLRPNSTGRYPRYAPGHFSSKRVDWKKRVSQIKREAPLCKCGCGLRVNVNTEKIINSRIKNYPYPDYLMGHGIRVLDQSLVPTQEEIDLIVGTCLGDGSIQYAHKEASLPRLVINHGFVQHDYVVHKAGILSRYKPSVKVVPNGGYGDKNSRLMTKSHSVFKKFRELFYVAAGQRYRKRIPKQLVEFLNERSMCYWFLDDGSSSSTSKHRTTCNISTEGFPKEDVFLLSDMVWNKIGIRFIPAFTRKYWYLRLNTDDADRFLNYIKPHVPECMSYKLAGR